MTEGWMKRDPGDYVFIFINELLKSTEENCFVFFFCGLVLFYLFLFQLLFRLTSVKI